MKKLPFELRKSASNSIDACQSISRNIAEGYARRSVKEYLTFLNYALGSSGELHSCMVSFRLAEQITADEFEQIDKLHFKTENELIQLIRALQKKLKKHDWDDSFIWSSHFIQGH